MQIVDSEVTGSGVRQVLRIFVTEERFGWNDGIHLTYVGSRILEEAVVERVGTAEGLST